MVISRFLLVEEVTGWFRTRVGVVSICHQGPGWSIIQELVTPAGASTQNTSVSEAKHHTTQRILLSLINDYKIK